MCLRLPKPIVVIFFVLLVSQIVLITTKADEKTDAKSIETSAHKYTNDLIRSTSPYLLQHAHNPVNWMEWGPAAFEKAKRENKPIFVSIGYSTCYWCHVMERESFENEEVAQILNESYVAIKVDREERPDIDEQLMLATQIMTGRGGWPNSVWLTVDGRPWMAGTYFPRDTFASALTQLADAWKQQADNVEKQANVLSNAVREAAKDEWTAKQQAQAKGQRALDVALEQMTQIYDVQHAGFGRKPKFPPHGMLRLLAWKARRGDDRATEMLTSTLDAMWCGGIHDHVGGGFHRYSTDEKWLLPHFEKMLYDNAQLMRAYVEAIDVLNSTRDDRETNTARLKLYQVAVDDIYQWLMPEMTHSDGGFYSAIDSESEGGEEGKYYTWTADQVVEVLGAKDGSQVAQLFNFESEGNFAEEATGERTGANIPYLNLADVVALDYATLRPKLEKLKAARQQREYPHLDDKIILAWNGLMISALARAGDVLDEQHYVDAAVRAAEFALDNMQSDRGLVRTWRAGKQGGPGYLNDYAFFIDGLQELYKATQQAHWKVAAEKLTEQMVELFQDPDGGFFFGSRHHEDLLLRSKNLTGGGNLPVGNGVALQVLLESHGVEPKPEYLDAVKLGLDLFQPLMIDAPQQVEHLILADELYRDFADSAR